MSQENHFMVKLFSCQKICKCTHYVLATEDVSVVSLKPDSSDFSHLEYIFTLFSKADVMYVSGSVDNVYHI